MNSKIFSSSDRTILSGLALLLVTGVFFNIYQKGSQPISPSFALAVVEIPRSFYSFRIEAETREETSFPIGPLDLNSARPEELENLPGVGPALAGRILDYRKKVGGFKSVRELLKVSGIGPKKLSQIAPQVQVGATKAGGFKK